MTLSSSAPSKRNWAIGRLPLIFLITSIAAASLLSLFTSQSFFSSRSVQNGANKYTHIEFDSHTSFRRDEDYSCSATKPCSNGACCAPTGYCGYGPASCGTGCVSQCNATAECGEFAEVPGTECPLKVCCSEFGFCGTTNDFCDTTTCQSNCGSPSVPAGASSYDVRTRVIGYYEAWSARRTCHPYPPESIAVDGLTHVNFAFASIEPGTFEIITMDSATEAELFQRTADIKTLKSGNADLEVFVAIGGWTFSDNGTKTQPLFSQIASTDSNRKKFANNLVKFMRKYGFDGVDLDWEYPGASDRGGLGEQDYKNYPLLLKTMRETFDASPRGGYGISFTIPSSYWYLRWFDLAELIKYADWINMMTYDLHGVWDANNPIGNVVQAHTNLTEISLACDLLWRNKVPPKQVVLGVGFYGRAFTLKDKNCAVPGCAFSGASKKGDCTGEGGILGYFEIQDILGDSKRKGKLVHDSQAAVNYLTYDTNQWISYDDKTTFQQKVDWANDIGLGGLMIWAVDLDDDKLTALSGLLDRKVGIPTPALASKDEKANAENWSSQNGQQCWRTSCGGYCNIGETEIGRDIGGCKKGVHKKICCPTTTAPQGCLWRGGESSSACNGQCHDGEVTMQLFNSTYGDGKNSHCINGGLQFFCCPAPRWKALIDECYWGKCGGVCESGGINVAERHDPVRCEYPTGGSGPQNRALCCPTKLENCHWVGQGFCDDNVCHAEDIQMDIDKYGKDNSACGLGRSKVLCCNAPADKAAFLPVDLEKIFPTLPPVGNTVRFDMQNLGANPPAKNDPTGDFNKGAFGFVLIDGPSAAVTSLSKRGGSHYEFIDCHKVTPVEDSKESKTVRIVCMDDGADSNCDDIYEEGAEGTIARLPDGCGEGAYVVVRLLKESQDQSMPAHIFSRKRSASKVMDLTFDYNFGLVKRVDEEVFIRIDYSNLPGYWDIIVDSPGRGSRRKRALDKRFFGNQQAWAEAFLQVKAVSAQYAPFIQEFHDVIVNTAIECGSEEAMMYMLLSGVVQGHARWGVSMVGTITPFRLEQSFAFFDTTIDTSVSLSVSVLGALYLAYTQKDLFKQPLQVDPFRVPGIIMMVPSLQVGVGIKSSDISLNAKFTTQFRSKTDNYITQYLPSSLGNREGQTQLIIPGSDQSYAGSIVSSSGNGNLRVSFQSILGMDIEIDNYAAATEVAHTQIQNSIEQYVSIGNNDGCTEFKTGVSRAMTDVLNTGANELWSGDSKETELIGTQPDSRLIKKVCTYDPNADTSSLAPTGPGLFDDDRMVECSTEDDATLSCDINLSEYIDEDTDPVTGELYENDADAGALRKRAGELIYDDELMVNATHSLVKRGGSRSFELCTDTAGKLKLNSKAYPSYKELVVLIGKGKVSGERYALADPGACTNADIIDDATTGTFVTEHILELQTIGRFTRSIVSGLKPSGARYAAQYTIPCSFFRQTWTTLYKDFPVSAPRTGSPQERIMSALGTTEVPGHFVLFEKKMNSMKATLWLGGNPVSSDKWKKMKKQGDAALTVIRRVIAVFNYLNNPAVNGNLMETANSIRSELLYWEGSVRAAGLPTADLVRAWDEFIMDLFDDIAGRAQAWVNQALTDVNTEFVGRLANGDKNAVTVLADVLILKALLNDIVIDYSDLD